MRRSLIFIALLALAGCGQKGPLYQPDAGIAVTPQASPAAPTGANGAAPVAPTPPASPDRSDEARKRIPQTPDPAQAR